jgi:hypothetical protein
MPIKTLLAEVFIVYKLFNSTGSGLLWALAVYGEQFLFLRLLFCLSLIRLHNLFETDLGNGYIFLLWVNPLRC